MGKFVDIRGQKFGRLTALEAIHLGGKNHVKWKCACECGNKVIVDGVKLRSGHTKSCGCYVMEVMKDLHKTHGLNGERIYKIWASMIQRCGTKSNKAYKNYGGRGISVCDEWKNFVNFYEWSISNGYTNELTIDRIDNDGNYCPENCRWTTPKEQARNKRNNRYLTYNGETKIIAEWADDFGLKQSLISMRLKRGWSIEECLTIPVSSHNRISSIRKFTK